MLLRNLLSSTSGDEHTWQVQPTMGTPLLVPVPKNVIFKDKIEVDFYRWYLPGG
jgi:hypothetical protein